jgi:uncharacterized protein (DUF885 family)
MTERPAERPTDPAATERFRQVAGAALDVLLESDPAWATTLGDHRFDARLPDLSPDGAATTGRQLNEAADALDDLDDADLDVQDQVDLEVLRTRLTARLWAHDELAEQTWNPLLSVPAQAVYALVARETDLPDERVQALTARLAGMAEHLAAVRGRLGRLPRVHVETAITQTNGVIALLGDPVDALADLAPGRRPSLDEARAQAEQALTDHARWLEDQLAEADRDPRLGARDFAAKLWYALDTETGPDSLLDRAESDLMAVEEAIDELAANLAPRLGVSADRPGRVRAVLDALAAVAPVSDHDLLDRCRAHLGELTQLVREHDLVRVPDDPVEVITMPLARRGVSVAYCDPPGPLEAVGPDGGSPTFYAVAPTPSDWSAQQVASFYREYNDYLLRDLTVHEAMPGHVVQQAHSRRFVGTTPVRAALWSGTFVEGWAVYAEEMVANLLLQVAPDDTATMALRMQQLKMQLRSTINAILDVRVHTRGMTEDEAMRLMTGRGHQEVGEAAGKWRRALMTSTQLSTYYVGYREVLALTRDLRGARPATGPRAVHDEVLAHGSPPPRLLRVLLDLPE